MTNSEKMLKHMAWANTEILCKVAQMPDEALEARGFDSINLDHYALWGFADTFGE